MAEESQKSENEDPVKNVKAESANKKRKRKEIAPYGNYRNYYGYRVGNDVEEDPRFKVLRKEWFEFKNCLDIGCNSGLITINIAKKFQCRSILGIDIDHDRINDAEWHLRNIVRKEEKAGKDHSKSSKEEGVERVNGTEPAETCSSNQRNLGMGNNSVERKLFDMVSFRCENFVSSWRALPLKHYDTIVCLHEKSLLATTGGILVLEPQPWESYYKNRLTTETTQMNYNRICFRPEKFQDILLDKIGFRTVEHAASSVSGASVGFDRPVLVFRK
ncbi:hypothetical protein Cgig2_027472 [Carnegiea gigantea]|uniref:RNA methyltransferase n=1 Tax=Carnegiea gigantea TaxID=171969 RepID=A0A9Q1KMV0_9CARY|nr:hypothetical protein Cgig2_027472 [Carnegiea gigantea]